MERNPCTRHRDGPYHDCAYVEARHRLMPEAEKRALAEVAHLEDGPAKSAKWSRAFNLNMDRLAREAGLIK